MSNVTTVVLAGGKGTRMKSALPKVLHQIAGKPLVEHTLEKLENLKLERILVVVGYKADQVKKVLGSKWRYVVQDQQLGTGHAALQALPYIPHDHKYVVLINGDDSAFYKPETLAKVISQHTESGKNMTLVSCIKKRAEVSGRIIRDDKGDIAGIKPNSQLTPEELASNHEFVCGVYVFCTAWLQKHLPQVTMSPKGEYNITSLVFPALKEATLNNFSLKDPQEWQSVNTPEELASANKLWDNIHLNPITYDQTRSRPSRLPRTSRR